MYSALMFLFLITMLWHSVDVHAAGAAQARTLQHDQRERHHLEVVPDIPGKHPLPLVIVLHGGGGNGENAMTMTGFDTLARREGFIAVFPYGNGRFDKRLLTWNAGHCCGYAMQNRIDDTGYLNALIDDIEARHAVDKQRIYLTGLSNGGMMTHQAGIALSHRLAAIAPVIATVFGDETRPLNPLPVLVINGLQDASVPFAGGKPGGRGKQAWDGTPALPAQDQFAFWARSNDCQMAGNPQRLPSVQHWRASCPQGVTVEWLVAEDSGHAWPGGKPGYRRADKPGQALDATAAIWEFFKAHPKRGMAEKTPGT